ncbi:MAG: Gfo/Idh/MocA family oxidoreductase [Caldilineaceae bacterium]
MPQPPAAGAQADTPRRVRLAMVGAGIYTRDAHLPALARLQERFELAAIFSRSESSAQALAEHWQTLITAGAGHETGLASPVSTSAPELFTDLAALFARGDIEAVDIALPIPVQAPIVAQALAAGKHVVSEKPIAPTRAEAQSLIDLHRRHPECVWMVAENWRYEEAFVRAAELMQRGAIGRPVVAHWAQYTPMTPASKYYVTDWRRAGEFAGGLLLDGGVHYISALRMLLGEVTNVAAMVKKASLDLNPVDTLTATLQFASGVQVSYLNTFAVGTPFSATLTIVGDGGSLRVERGKLELAGPAGAGPGKGVEEIRCAFYNGVENELAAFGSAIVGGAPHRNSPLEALTDFAVVEAMLASAADGQFHAPVI